MAKVQIQESNGSSAIYINGKYAGLVSQEGSRWCYGAGGRYDTKGSKEAAIRAAVDSASAAGGWADDGNYWVADYGLD